MEYVPIEKHITDELDGDGLDNDMKEGHDDEAGSE